MEIVNSLRFNVNLVYISYHVIYTELPQIIVIADYAKRFDKLQDSLESKAILPFKEWLVDPINYDVTKDSITQISLIELKNVSVKVGVSKFDAIDKYWNNLFDVYRGYLSSARGLPLNEVSGEMNRG